MKQRSPDAEVVEIGVVIPFHGEWDSVERLVRSLMAQTAPPREIVCVMDGASEQERARLESQFARWTSSAGQLDVRVERQEWAGVSAARNRGAAAIRSPTVVFVEADGEYSANYLERLAALLADPRVGAVSPESRIVLTRSEGWIARYQRARWEGIRALTRLGRRRVLGGWAFRKSELLRAGGYDETLHVGEDRDLVERLRELGLAIVVARRTWFRHPEPSTFRDLCRKTYSRARKAGRYYALRRRRVLIAARLLPPVCLLALGGVLAVWSSWPLLALLLCVGFGFGLLVLLARSYCEPLIVAAARHDRTPLAAHVVFAMLRSAEAVASVAAIALAAWSPELVRIPRGRVTRNSVSAGLP